MHKELALLSANRTATQPIQTPRQQLQMKYFTHSHSAVNANDVAVTHAASVKLPHHAKLIWPMFLLTIEQRWLIYFSSSSLVVIIHMSCTVCLVLRLKWGWIESNHSGYFKAWDRFCLFPANVQHIEEQIPSCSTTGPVHAPSLRVSWLVNEPVQHRHTELTHSTHNDSKWEPNLWPTVFFVRQLCFC